MVANLEIGRKSVHLFGYLLVFFVGWYIYSFYGVAAVKTALLLLLIALLLGDYLTIDLGLKIPIYTQCQRSSERKLGIHSATFGIVGVLLSLEFFELRIAVATGLMMAISDPFSSLSGKLFWQKKIFKKKTIVGAVASLVINLLIAGFMLDKIWVIAGTALAATVVESFVEKIDDNLTVPLFAGLVGQLLSYI